MPHTHHLEGKIFMTEDYAITTVVNDDMLSQVDTFDSAMAMISAYNLTPIDISETIDEHFAVTSKEDLLNREMLVLRARKKMDGENGRYWTVWAITRDSKRVMFSDGSTGIAKQLDNIEREEGTLEGKPFMLGGLRVSRYTYVDEAGRKKDAQTFYLKPHRQ